MTIAAQDAFGSKIEDIYETLVKMVRNGDYKPGDKLPNERALADRFQTGRAILRQALARIQGQGLIVRRVGSGTYISDNAAQIIETQDAQVNTQGSGPFNFSSILEARLLFEPGVAALAAANAGPENLRLMKARLQDLLEVESWLEFKEAIYAVTLSIYQAAGNDFLSNIFEQVIKHRRLVNYDGRATESSVSELVKVQAHFELKKIVDAILSGDGKEAESLCQDYILKMFTSVNL